jgi:hypothetical protein
MRQHRPGEAMLNAFRIRTKQLNYKGYRMSMQMLEDYAEELDNETDDDVRWFEYCRTASTLGREDILAVVLDELSTQASPLFDLIDDALQNPHEPGRPKESMTVLAGIGTAILHLVAKAVDDAVGHRMAVEVPRD